MAVRERPLHLKYLIKMWIGFNVLLLVHKDHYDKLNVKE